MSEPLLSETERVMSAPRLQKQKEFILAKIQTCKQFDKFGLTLVDSNNIIISSLMGELRNIVLSFFKGGLYSVKRCEHCGTLESRQFDRAHDKSTSRSDVALQALHRIRPDETQPVKQKDFIKAFIMEHSTIPLWMLCRACHIKYDS